MKREVSRKRTLPAFRLDAAELELLWQQLLKLFDGTKSVYAQLTIELSGEKIEFDDVAELKGYERLPSRLKNFSLWFHQGDSRISIGSSSLLGSRPEVRASGNTEAWCAGAVETVATFVDRHRVWYHWFLIAPIGWLFALLRSYP